MMMILPGTADGPALLTALKKMHARLLEHASLLWQPETTDAIRSAHESVIGQILTTNLLRIQAFWSHYRFRRQNTLMTVIAPATPYDQCDLQPAQDVVKLARCTRSLTTGAGATALAHPQTDALTVARIAPLAPTATADYRHRAFWLRLRYFCRLYLLSSRWLARVENASPISVYTPPRSPGLMRYTDNVEALLSGVRTFFALGLVGAWSITTQWEYGSAALTLAAISCVLYSVSPAPFNSLTLLLRTLLLLSLFSFVVKFGLMVQISELWSFCCFCSPC